MLKYPCLIISQGICKIQTQTPNETPTCSSSQMDWPVYRQKTQLASIDDSLTIDKHATKKVHAILGTLICEKLTQPTCPSE